jgi:hypothetical protein
VTLVLVLFGLVLGCSGPGRSGNEAPTSTDEEYVDKRGFDPLELPRDREIVPLKYPKTGSIHGSGALVDAAEDPTDNEYYIADSLPVAIDTLNSQVFRVQLFTSKQFGQARKAVVVAEEIFDQPVYLDYEVPYYKVRVGNFADRDDAEEYRPKVQTAGYKNAWVVVVNLGVKEAAPVYDDLQEDTFEDILPAETEQNEDDQKTGG